MVIFWQQNIILCSKDWKKSGPSIKLLMVVMIPIENLSPDLVLQYLHPEYQNFLALTIQGLRYNFNNFTFTSLSFIGATINYKMAQPLLIANIIHTYVQERMEKTANEKTEAQKKLRSKSHKLSVTPASSESNMIR